MAPGVAVGLAAGSASDRAVCAGRPGRCCVVWCAEPRGVALAVVAAPGRTAAAAAGCSGVAARLAAGCPVTACLASRWSAAVVIGVVRAAVIGAGCAMRALVLNRPRDWLSEWLADRPPDRWLGRAARQPLDRLPDRLPDRPACRLLDRQPDRRPDRRPDRAAARRLVWLLGWPLDPPRMGGVVAALALGAPRRALTRAPMRLPMCARIHALARRRRRAHGWPQVRTTARPPAGCARDMQFDELLFLNRQRMKGGSLEEA